MKADPLSAQVEIETCTQDVLPEHLKTGNNVDYVAVARPTSIIQRLSETQEVAAMVVYACGDLASSTTGATLRVEGGIVTGLG